MAGVVDQFMTLEECADYLRLAPSTIYKKTHGLPYRKHGRKLVFRKSEIDAWSESRASRAPITSSQSKFSMVKERLRSLKTEQTTASPFDSLKYQKR